MARQAGAQQQRQQLGIGQCGGAAGEQLLARAGVGGQVQQGVHARREGPWIVGAGVARKIAASLSPKLYRH